MSEDLYRINDALTALASELGARPSDETLNDLTHEVARRLGVSPTPEPDNDCEAA